MGRKRVSWTIFPGLAWCCPEERTQTWFLAALTNNKQTTRVMGSSSRWSPEPGVTEGQFVPTRGSGL